MWWAALSEDFNLPRSTKGTFRDLPVIRLIPAYRNVALFNVSQQESMSGRALEIVRTYTNHLIQKV